MNESNEQLQLLYIQKQEQLLLENIRTRLDYEMKLHLLNDRLNTSIEKINELQHTLESQHHINKQAVESFERISIEKEQLKSTISLLESKNKELETAAHQLTTKTIEFNASKEKYENRIKDLQVEINRQSQELESLYNEANSKKSKKLEVSGSK